MDPTHMIWATSRDPCHLPPEFPPLTLLLHPDLASMENIKFIPTSGLRAHTIQFLLLGIFFFLFFFLIIHLLHTNNQYTQITNFNI